MFRKVLERNKISAKELTSAKDQGVTKEKWKGDNIRKYNKMTI